MRHKRLVLGVSAAAGVAAFAWALATTELTPEVVSELSRADPEARSRMETLRRDVRESVAKGDVARAARLQEELVRLDPASVRERLRLAELLREAGREEEARESLEATADMQLARARRAGDAVVEWEQAASALGMAGREEESREAMARAAELHLREGERGNRAESWERGAELFTRLGEEKRAREAWLGAARRYERAGLDEGGRMQVRTRLAALDTAYDYFVRAGKEERARESARRMIEEFRELAETNENAVWTPLYVGWAHRRLGDEEEARRVWGLGRERADRMVEQGFFAFGWYNTACLRALAGDAEAAIEALERAAQSPPVTTEHVLRDRDLRSLHDHPRFREIAERFRGGRSERY